MNKTNESDSEVEHKHNKQVVSLYYADVYKFIIHDTIRLVESTINMLSPSATHPAYKNYQGLFWSP